MSGLAIGIDGAAHEGALDAGGLAVGVVATGLDVVYPRRHRALYDRVREHGLVVGEHGYGVQPRRERFPVRNRIIAALADVVVVVEATATGGARITGEIRRRVRPRRVRAARVASQSGRRGLQRADRRRRPPIHEPSDLLVALGRGGSRPGPWTSDESDGPSDRDEKAVLHALGGDPATIDDLERNTSALGPARLGAALNRLERAGRVQRRRGLWWPN